MTMQAARTVALEARAAMHAGPREALAMARSLARHGDDWLPEAMALLATPGIGRRAAQLAAASLGLPPLGSLNGAVGRIGLSFPIWRFLAMGAGGLTLLELAGMERLRRETDREDGPTGPRDLLGTGYVRSIGSVRLELRRSYVAVSSTDEGNRAALVIRNSSHHFGRDRLPLSAYVSFDALEPSAMDGITAGFLEVGAPFMPWSQAASAGRTCLPPAERARRLRRLVRALDKHDSMVSRWLLTADGGLTHLSDLLRRIDGPSSPWLARVDRRLPPWLPYGTRRADSSLIPLLSTMRASGCLDARMRTVLLSGPDGDLPA